jgi:hypothetical protein
MRGNRINLCLLEFRVVCTLHAVISVMGWVQKPIPVRSIQCTVSRALRLEAQVHGAFIASWKAPHLQADDADDVVRQTITDES